MKKKFIIILISIIFSSSVYSADYETLELPLGLTYGIFKGLDINFFSGGKFNPSFPGFLFYTTLGIVTPTEPVVYYKNEEHFWGTSHTASYARSFASIQYFYIGYMLSLGVDLCFNTTRFTAGAKTDFDLMFCYESFRINAGIAAGVFDKLFYAAPKIGFEFDFNYPFTFVATYTEGRLFNFDLSRASLGVRINL